MVEWIGYFGLVMMLLCLVPQLIKTIREGHADGLALGYLTIGWLGMALLLIYVLLTSGSWPLLINYAYNTVAFGVLIRYKLFPRR